MAIKITNLEELSEQYKQKNYYYNDLHLDFSTQGEFSSVIRSYIPGNDVKVDYDESAIRNSLKNLFNTKPGQRFLFPRYGLDLNQYLFEPCTAYNGKVIGEKIVHSIKLFEPRIVCRNCDVKALMDLNTYDITIVAEIPIINTTFSINSSLDLKKQMFIFAETSRNI